MSFTEPRAYRSDDLDLDDCDNDLRVSMGGNGDWYVEVVPHGRKLGPYVRVTTSGTRRAQQHVPAAVHELYRAMGGEPPLGQQGTLLSFREMLEEGGQGETLPSLGERINARARAGAEMVAAEEAARRAGPKDRPEAVRKAQEAKVAYLAARAAEARGEGR